MIMKRYAAFAYPNFYPSGGFEDFIESFDTLDEAKAAVVAHHAKEDTFDPQGHVADTTELKLICHFDTDGWYDADAAD